jgi:peroxiredoxin
MKNLVLSLLLLVFTVTASAQVLAPDFTVVDTEGNVHNLYDYCEDGKIVVLDFFYVGCSYCEYYSAHIQQSYEDFGCNQGDVIFLGLDWNDTDAEVQWFDSTYGITYPSASGIDGGADTVQSLYNISIYTTVLVVGPDKQIKKDIKPPTCANIDSFLLILGAQMMPCNVGIEEAMGVSSAVELINNPVDESKLVALSVEQQGDYRLQLTDMFGRVLYDQSTHLESGISNVQLPQSLEAGMYILNVQKDNEAWEFKVLIQ